MQFLRQNTAVLITVGPFYDKTDGVTIETALTISNERITLTADTDDNNAPTNILDNVTGATSGTSNDLNYITGNDAGMMQLELSAANTNRVGRCLLSITDAANHVPVFMEFFVLPAAIYDWLTAGAAPLTPTTAGRTLDVTATGEAGIDWANIGGPTTAVNLSGTTVKTATDVETDTADIQTRLPAALTAGGNMKSDALALSGDTTAADNAESFFDGTGYAGTNNVIPIVTTVTGLTAANLDVAVSTRMATYSQPAGFLGATFPTTVASTTNITTVGSIAAGGITQASFGSDVPSLSIRTNTAQAGDATHITLDASANATNDYYNNTLIKIDSGTGAGQSRFIVDYVGATKVAQVATWVTNPDNTSVFSILPFDSVAGASAPTAAQVATAVWQDTTAGDFTLANSVGKSVMNGVALGTGLTINGYTGNTPQTGDAYARLGAPAGASVSADVAAVNAKTTNLPASPASTTNISAGTITTVTNLTNAPTNGDFTATMKTSIGTAVAASAVASVTAPVSIAASQLFVKKNTQLTSFMFKMVLASDHITPATGKTITATRAIDGGAFASCANSVTEISAGWYKITLAAADLNGTMIALKFTEAACDQRDILIVTQA